MDKRYGEDGTDYHLWSHRSYEYWLFGATLAYGIDGGGCSSVTQYLFGYEYRLNYSCRRCNHRGFCFRCAESGWWVVVR
jgi:hypothetical protein